MSEFLGSLYQGDLPFTIFMMVMSMVIAIFQTMILSGFNLKFPSWPFFVVNPLAIGLGYLIYPSSAEGVFFILFLLTVILFIMSGFYNVINGMLRKRNENKNKTGKKTSIWKTITKIFFSLLFLILFSVFGKYFFFFIAVLIIMLLILPSSESRFLQLQKVLPTANIRSMAMGLIEVKGKIKAHKPLISKIGRKKCVGYQYIIEKITWDKDHGERFTTILNETVCNDFYIEDKTGKALVSSDSLDFLWFPISDRTRSGGKRYTQYLLLEGEEVLIVGMATNKNQQIIISREPIKDVFTISPVKAINQWYKDLPLSRSAAIFSIILGIISILILLSNISIVNNTMFVSLWSTSG